MLGGAAGFVSNAGPPNNGDSHMNITSNSCVLNGSVRDEQYLVLGSNSTALVKSDASTTTMQGSIATPSVVTDGAWYPNYGASNHLTVDLTKLQHSTPFIVQVK